MIRSFAIFSFVLVASTGAVRADWLDDANARIEAHRKAGVSVEVVDAAGHAVPGAAVAVRQIDHAFRWGTAVSSDYYAAAGTPSADRLTYQQKIATLFNQVVLENGHKWRPWENAAQRNRANATAEAMLAQGKTIRGHTMVWQRPGSLPDDVNAMIAANDAAGLVARTKNHIANVGGALRGKVSEWDVVNEQWNYHGITDVVNPGVPIERAPLLAEWFRAARAADANATLYLNDWGILASGGLTNSSHQQSVFDTASYLKQQGVPLGGLGFQSHFGSANARTSGDKLVQILDRFATLGVELQVTEFDMYGPGWTEALKASYMREFMTAVFSSEAVVGFNMWGFWDGQHFENAAPLFDANWNLKQSGQVFMDLVFGDWWTDVSGMTDAAGVYVTRGFLGEYAVDVTIDGRTTTRLVTLDASGQTLSVVVPEPAALASLVLIVAIGRRVRRSA